MLRKALILLLLGGILACAGVLMFLAQTPEGTGFVRDVIQSAVEEKTGLQVNLGSVDINPWRSELELTDLSVGGKEAPRLAGFSSLRVGLAPLQLLSGTVVVDSFEVDHPYVNLTVRDGRIVGLPVIEGSDEATKLDDRSFIRLFVRAFRMSGLDVRVKVEGNFPVEVVLRDVRAALDEEGGDLHGGTFSVAGGDIFLPKGGHARIATLDGQASVQGDGLLRPEQLNIAQARMEVDGVGGNMRGTVRFAPLSTGLIPAADLLIRGHVPISQFPEWFPNLLPMFGNIDFDAHFRSAFGGKNATAMGSGELKNIELNGFVIGNVAGDFLADVTGADFTNVKSDFGGAEINGQGRVDFGKEVTAKFTARGEHGSFGQGISQIQVPGSWVDFNIDADVEFAGTLYPEFRFDGHGVADVTNLRVYTESYLTAGPEDLVMSVGPIKGHSGMEFDFHHFSFVNGTISDGKTTVTGSVFLPFGIDRDMIVDASADPEKRPGEAFDCESVSPIAKVELTCRGPGVFHIRGRYIDPRMYGTAQLKNVSVQGYHLGDAAGDFDYHNLLLRFLDVKGKKVQTRWDGNATLNWRAYLGLGPDDKPLGRPRTKRDTLYVTVAARNVQGRAEDIRSAIPPGWGSVMEYLRTLPMTGQVSGWADARGAIGDITVDDLTFETEWDLGSVSIYGQQFDDGHVSAHMDLKKFYFDDLTLHRAGSRWHGAGPIARADGAVRIDATVENMPLAQLDALSEATSPIEGRFDALINARGAVTDWQGPVRLDFANVSYGDIPIGDGGLDLMMGGGRIKGIGPVFDGRAKLKWDMKLEPPWQFIADLDVERGPAQDLVGMEALPKGLTLTFGGDVHAEGALSEFGRTRGWARLERASLGYRELALRSDGDLKMRFNGARVDMDQFVLLTDDGSKLELKGGVTPDALDLDLEVQSDLAISKVFVRSVKEANGPLSLRLGISGTPDEPVLVGQGRLMQGYLDVDGFPHKFKNLDSNISFIRDRIVFDPFIFDLDDSPTRGHAEVLLKGYTIDRITLTTRFQNLRFRMPDYLPSKLSGTITMTGTPDDMLLWGDIDVLEATYSDSWDWERIQVDLRRRRLAPRVYDKAAEWLTLDLHLRADDKIHVKNANMQAEFKGDLQLTGSNERVGLVGTLTSLGGRAFYRNNTFELGRSTVDFIERNRIAVVLDVEATTRVKQYDVWVDVEGPVEQLSAEQGIRLRSRPDLPAGDVLYLVLFGFTQNDLNNLNAASGNAAAVSSAVDFLSTATGVDKEVRRVLGREVVDEFYLTTVTPRRPSATAQGSVPAAVVGTELWGGRLRVTSTLPEPGNNATDQSVQWEKRWSEHFYWRVVYNRNSALQQYGDAGTDVRYRWEF